MFLKHFKLREQPFGVTPDPRYLFPSSGHREALASLIYGIESNLGFGAVIAGPGMGKTTLLFHILERYRQSAHTAFLFNTKCDSHDLLQALVAELDDKPSPRDAFQLHERLKQILIMAAEARQKVILVIDEAHNLSDTAMETVRLLSNFESACCKLLHIVLAGQPELAARLARPELSQFRQRIPILNSLSPLSHLETAIYVDHRLRVAGYQGESMFTPEALARISEASRGVPREINRLCFNCLSLAYASDREVVDYSIVEEVAADLDLCLRIGKGDQPAPAPAHHATAVQDPGGAIAAGSAAPGRQRRDRVDRQPLPARATMCTTPQPPTQRAAAIPQRQTSGATEWKRARPKSSWLTCWWSRWTLLRLLLGTDPGGVDAESRSG